MQVPYTPGGVYHIFNHANGRENVFESEENYFYFLKKYAEKLEGVVTTLAYCLMPNHFHLLVRVKTEEELEQFITTKSKKLGKSAIPPDIDLLERYHYIVHRQFHNFLGGYVKAFNKYHDRKGSLLRQNTRRKIVSSPKYLINAIIYIHMNPVYHQFVATPEEWQHSSYRAYRTNKPTRLARNEVLEYFNGAEAFTKIHHARLQNALLEDWEQ